MKTTYFKVDRAIQNHWLWQDKPFSRGQAWIDLLLLAAYKDHRAIFNGHIITRKRGEVHASIGFFSDRWGWSRNKVYRFIKELKKDGMVTSSGTTDGTVIHIEKYTFYQDEYITHGTPHETTNGTTAEQPRNNHETTAEHNRKKDITDKKDNNYYFYKDDSELYPRMGTAELLKRAEEKMDPKYRRNLEEIRRRKPQR